MQTTQVSRSSASILGAIGLALSALGTLPALVLVTGCYGMYLIPWSVYVKSGLVDWDILLVAVGATGFVPSGIGALLGGVALLAGRGNGRAATRLPHGAIIVGLLALAIHLGVGLVLSHQTGLPVFFSPDA